MRLPLLIISLIKPALEYVYIVRNYPQISQYIAPVIFLFILWEKIYNNTQVSVFAYLVPTNYKS